MDVFGKKRHFCVVNDASDESEFKMSIQTVIKVDASASTEKSTNSENLENFTGYF